MSIFTKPQNLSSSKTLSFTQLPIQLTTTTTNLSFKTKPSFLISPIRMGGGPRTYPGGVTKWQWKRMQAKKSKQLLQARLSRERQIYEMRKRSELKAAVSELERPWETVEKPPNLFSVGADEQLKVLADRFQKPGGLDLWSERDGPELLRADNGLPSARFFPKGVVHSVKPYGRVEQLSSGLESLDMEEETSLRRKGYSEKVMRKHGSLKTNDVVNEIGSMVKGNRRKDLSDLEPKRIESRNSNGVVREDKSVMTGNRRRDLSDSEPKRIEPRSSNSVVRKGKSVMTVNRRKKDLNDSEKRKSGYDGKNQRREYGKSRVSEEIVFDMSLQNDGSYGLK